MSLENHREAESLTGRVNQLETLFLHLQRDYNLLNDVLTQQVETIERLSKRLDLLLNRLDQLEAHVEVHRDPRDEKPPHY